jgi:hypothetical protein
MKVRVVHLNSVLTLRLSREQLTLKRSGPEIDVRRRKNGLG